MRGTGAAALSVRCNWQTAAAQGEETTNQPSRAFVSRVAVTFGQGAGSKVGKKDGQVALLCVSGVGALCLCASLKPSTE